jgi:hypothetical protein
MSYTPYVSKYLSLFQCSDGPNARRHRDLRLVTSTMPICSSVCTVYVKKYKYWKVLCTRMRTCLQKIHIDFDRSNETCESHLNHNTWMINGVMIGCSYISPSWSSGPSSPLYPDIPSQRVQPKNRKRNVENPIRLMRIWKTNGGSILEQILNLIKW